MFISMITVVEFVFLFSEVQYIFMRIHKWFPFYFLRPLDWGLSKILQLVEPFQSLRSTLSLMWIVFSLSDWKWSYEINFYQQHFQCHLHISKKFCIVKIFLHDNKKSFEDVHLDIKICPKGHLPHFCFIKSEYRITMIMNH